MSLQGLFESFGGSLTNQIFTTTIGEVVEMDREYNRVKKLLIKKEEKLNITDDVYLYNVPIITHQNKDFVMLFPYKTGDKVQVLFSHRDLSNILANDGSDPNAEKFKMEYALVIGAPILFDDPIAKVKDTEETDVVFAKRDGGASLIIKDNNDVIINSEGNIYLGDKDNAKELNKELKEWLDNHTHSNEGSGKPNSASPAHSKKVFVE